MVKYLIIGGSAGGIGAVEGIREVDPTSTISVISEEPIPYYSRPMIGKLLSQDVNLEKMKYRSDGFWEKMNAILMSGKKAVNLNLDEKYVEIEGGDTIKFEKLLIATGGKPQIPPIKGIDKQGVFSFSNLSDVKQISEKIEKEQKSVVLGGGLIGVNVAEALMKRGLEVTIIELKDKILNLILDEKAANIIEERIRERGIRIVTGQTIQEIRGNPESENDVGSVILANGEEIFCDLLIIAVGIKPRIELAEQTEIATNNGILVNEQMCTNVPYVYACGDVSEIFDFVLEDKRVLPLWPLAYSGGKVAGHNMAGKKDVLIGTSMNALDYFDIPIISFGASDPEEEHEDIIYEGSGNKEYRKIVFKENTVLGMISVNEIAGTGTIFHLMKNRVNLKEIKQQLLSDDFNIAKLPVKIREELFSGD